MSKTKSHGTNSFQGSFTTMVNCLGPFVANNFLQAITLGSAAKPGLFVIEGELPCLGEIVIRVKKLLPVLSGTGLNAIVKTAYYEYNVSIRGAQNIMRYDCAAHHHHNQDPHHKHRFDLETGKEILDKCGCCPLWIGEDNWPHLSDVVQEAHDWYYEHWNALDNPYTYPSIGLRK